MQIIASFFYDQILLDPAYRHIIAAPTITKPDVKTHRFVPASPFMWAYSGRQCHHMPVTRNFITFYENHDKFAVIIPKRWISTQFRWDSIGLYSNFCITLYHKHIYGNFKLHNFMLISVGSSGFHWLARIAIERLKRQLSAVQSFYFLQIGRQFAIGMAHAQSFGRTCDIRPR